MEKKMKKTISITLILSTTLILSSLDSAECSQVAIDKSNKIFADSRDEATSEQRIALIKQAKKICDTPQISIEMERLKIEHLLSKNILEDLEDRLHTLQSRINNEDNLPYDFRFNTKRQIMGFFKGLYTKQKGMLGKKSAFGGNIKNLDSKLANLDKRLTNDLKSLEDVGGLYHSQLKFLKNSSTINDKQEAKGLKAKIVEIVASYPNALFSVTGHASSEGSLAYNSKLSQQRAKSFVAFVGKHKKNIKPFYKGERLLVCNDELLPEKDENGERRCVNGEDKKASRRVEVRRVR
jgi:outer membrane protein OmpA-like peptidoglycan-associated protein